MEKPLITVVIEAFHPQTEEKYHFSLDDTMRSLFAQEYPRERTEFIVCTGPWSEQQQQQFLSAYPGVRLTQSPLQGYFRIKNHGIRQATGEVIALADGDCVYSPGWLSAIADSINAGNDIAIGLTNLRGHEARLLPRLGGFYDFHWMLVHDRRGIFRFNSNNVAFRAALIKSELYNEQFERAGGCVELAWRLHARGAKANFNAEQRVTHNYYGFVPHFWVQPIGNGYQLLLTRKVNRGMPLAGLVKLKLLTAPLLSMLFWGSDVVSIFQNRKVMGASWLHVPAYLLSSFSVRVLEIVGIAWCMLNFKRVEHYVTERYA